jgi:iron complex outermembrane receptor protein
MPDGSKNTDAWGVTQLGFRMDFDLSSRDALFIKGDFYDGTRKTDIAPSPLNGQNITASWTRKFSDVSDFKLNVYYDRYFREDIPGTGSDEMNTADVDFQHRFPIRKRHNVLWGLGYRYVSDHARFSTNQVAILPPKKNLDLINGFIQDEIQLGRRIRFTLGSKILHNVYTGIELQPTARLAAVLRRNHTLWGAVSRAVRTPSRYDVDYYLPGYNVPPPNPSVAGGPNFESEKLIAYELGYHIQPSLKTAFTFSTFYNVYRDVYSVEALPGTLTYQIMNGSEGEAWGIEVTANYQPAPKWRLRGGYIFIDKDLRPKPGRTFNPDYLANDARHRVKLHSIVDLPLRLQFDVVARYVDKLKQTLATTAVDDYVAFDARLAWVSKHIEISVTGQNLPQKKHREFGTFDIPRQVYGKIAARF